MSSAAWQAADEYAELYVISDLHMGGTSGFQIFNQGRLLGEFIDKLAGRPADAVVGLVINGDTVDFLAEPNATYFDPAGAPAKLDRIAHDAAFGEVFAALRRFTATPNRRLIITLGNHDLELALPWVRTCLLRLVADDERAQGRVTLAFDGAGYPARVGSATIYCVHGNDVDEWNVTDYETIRRQGRDIAQGLPVDAWTPNAGTKLVIEVMNDIKRRFPFVDLLKPELEAVVPTLYALDPSLKSKLAGVLSVAARLTWDKIRIRAGFLSADLLGDQGQVVLQAPGPAPDSLVDALVQKSFATPAVTTAEQLLAQARQEVVKGRFASDLPPESAVVETLGIGSAIKGWFTGASPVEMLRRALEDLRHNQSFVRTDPDTTFRRMDELVSAEAAIVITGHTHMERARQRERGRGFYYNSGTWVRLIQLTAEWLRDEASFQPVYDALAAGTMAALDALQAPQPLVTLNPCVVQIRRDGGRTKACLLRPKAGGAALGTVVEDSQFEC